MPSNCSKQLFDGGTLCKVMPQPIRPYRLVVARGRTGLLKVVTLAVWAVAVAVVPAAAEVSVAGIIGTYEVTGTEADGQPYAAAGVVDVALAPSGALELQWDNGRAVGVGQMIGDVLAVSSSAKGRILIMLMTVNPDGTLSGKWWRRTDRGSKGTEIWKKK